MRASAPFVPRDRGKAAPVASTIHRSLLDPFERASRHPILCDKPAPDFFEGAVLGNGGLGVIVCTRPDAVVLRLGHNNVWDIRVSETKAGKIGTFAELIERMRRTWDEGGSIENGGWLSEYCGQMREDYAKSYPRPFPCGSVVLGFDRRAAEMLGHRLDVSTGKCEVFFLVGTGAARARHTLEIGVDMRADHVWLRMTDEHGRLTGAPFNRVRLIPDTGVDATNPFGGKAQAPAPDEMLPAPIALDVGNSASTIAFRQRLPYRVNDVAADHTERHNKDRAFRLCASFAPGGLTVGTTNNSRGKPQPMDALERALRPPGAGEDFIACVQLDEGLEAAVPSDARDVAPPTRATIIAAQEAAIENWRAFWRRSGVALEDEFLERVWYHNLYFFHCAIKPGVTCPGLFANWSHKLIGTAWHGDYHFDYNVEQPFWLTFSSNHNDELLVYADLIESLMPLSRQWARDYYGMRGACFPLSPYPVDMTTNPYPLPTWGWIVSIQPWAVQNLWWHYLYTGDEKFLRDRALPAMKEVVLFLVDYITRTDATARDFGDGKHHVCPTVVPELYGLTDRFEKNHDCIADLTLTRFLFRAFTRGCEIVGWTQSKGELLAQARDILDRLPPNPTADAPGGGRVFVPMPGASPEIVQNCPVTTMTVFPGEEHGLHSPADEFAIASNTYRQQQNEGGNDLVFLNMQGARLGLLDLERFKRQIRYCLLPNGTCTDMVMQVHCRYGDETPNNYMGRMGIWFENFALPAVVNECLLQSYNGTIRLFPNWPKDKDAEFRTLRAAGAFLVSAAFVNGQVQWIEITSEVGSPLRLINPWNVPARCGDKLFTGERIEMSTRAGETFILRPA